MVKKFKWITETKNIRDIRAGDIVVRDNIPTTVCNRDIKRDEFMGITLFGDTYNLGYKPVTIQRMVEV